MEKKLIIDVSTHQKEIDWDLVKAQGIGGAILRIGYTGWGTGKTKSKDYRFERNYAECQRLGIDTGVYWYSCAVTEAEAIVEATKTLAYLNNRPLQFPIFFDTEDTHDIDNGSPVSQLTLVKTKGKKALTDIAIAFCETIKNAGYMTGVYANLYWFKNQLNVDELTKYYIWVAQYNDTCDAKHRYDIWQYSSTVKLDGVPTNYGYVDANYLYVDFQNTNENTENNESENEETMLLKCIKVSTTKGYPYRNKAGGTVTGYYKVGDLIKITNAYSFKKVANVGSADAWFIDDKGNHFAFDKNYFS